MRREDSDSNSFFSSGENSDHEYEEEQGARRPEMVSGCRCGRDKGRCMHCCKRRTKPDAMKGEFCETQWGLITRYSEGYGTEEECGQSDPQGESDADADIEDTDSRLPETGPLQRISSRRRRRQRVPRQDTTESEDDGGRSHRVHRWNLRLSPHRTHGRTILEESVSQVRPLVLCRPCVGQGQPDTTRWPKSGMWSLCRWPLLLSVSLVLLLLLPVFAVIIILFLRSSANT
ncbi:uncharacterized protein [Paramormyrops kingsleyae]|uniref:uncharacterized protein n=1 Tax=Paramormyrops kingsleyae TaxID=1676925 RepID=UPI000CD5DD5E|nr:uncharacterized protein LOC111858106 [Paramormyrops kingsleyae]